MRVTCDRCLRRYDVPDAAVSGRKIRARCKCGARIVLQVRAPDGTQPESTPESKGRPKRWFVDITSWEPITMDMRQLVRAFAAGRIDADTLVWCKGMPDWRRLRDVDELAERLLGMAPGGGGHSRRSTLPPEGPSSAPSQPPRSRTPRASYIVPSTGDTLRLSQVIVTDTPASSPGSTPLADPTPTERSAAAPGASAASPNEPPSPNEPAARGDASPQREDDSAPPTSVSSALVLAGLSFDDAGAPGESALASADAPSPAAGEPLGADGGGSASEADAREGSEASATAPLAEGTDTSSPAARSREADPIETSRSGGFDRAGDAPATAGDVSTSRSDAQASLRAPGDEHAAAERSRLTEPARVAESSSHPAQLVRRGASTPALVSATSTPSARPRSSNRYRRRSSSEETPAQKPSSLSVAPRGARPQGMRLAALATLAVIWAVSSMNNRATEQAAAPLTAEPVAEAPPTLPAEQSAPAPGTPEPNAVEPRDVGLSATPTPPEAAANDAREAAKAPPGNAERVATATPSTPVTAAAPSPRPAAPATAPLAAPRSGQAMATPRPTETKVLAQPAPRAPASTAGAKLDVTKQPTAAPASVPQKPIAAASTDAARTQPEAAAPLTPAEAATASPSPASAGVIPGPPVRPGPFDMQRAEQEMSLAADAAAQCGQAGPTRGTGQVKVLVEPWGRVVRVTHLQQDFVGTPVGICVMQAYQRVQVPPFEGGTRSLIGTFIVK